MNEPSLKAREIEALVYVFDPGDRPSLVPDAARSRMSFRNALVAVGAITGLALLGTLVKRIFL